MKSCGLGSMGSMESMEVLMWESMWEKACEKACEKAFRPHARKCKYALYVFTLTTYLHWIV
jgi:hypothetical protein